MTRRRFLAALSASAAGLALAVRPSLKVGEARFVPGEHYGRGFIECCWIGTIQKITPEIKA